MYYLKIHLLCSRNTISRSQHFEMFMFHLNSAYHHRIFVSDSNHATRRPNHPPANGVITIIRDIFPGFDTARRMDIFTVEDRYIVVKLVIENAPVYVHNVYALQAVDRRMTIYTGKALKQMRRIWF